MIEVKHLDLGIVWGGARTGGFIFGSVWLRRSQIFPFVCEEALDQRDAFRRGNEKMQRSQGIIFAEYFPSDA